MVIIGQERNYIRHPLQARRNYFCELEYFQQPPQRKTCPHNEILAFSHAQNLHPLSSFDLSLSLPHLQDILPPSKRAEKVRNKDWTFHKTDTSVNTANERSTSPCRPPGQCLLIFRRISHRQVPVLGLVTTVSSAPGPCLELIVDVVVSAEHPSVCCCCFSFSLSPHPCSIDSALFHAESRAFTLIVK